MKLPLRNLDVQPFFIRVVRVKNGTLVIRSRLSQPNSYPREKADKQRCDFHETTISLALENYYKLGTDKIRNFV